MASAVVKINISKGLFPHSFGMQIVKSVKVKIDWRKLLRNPGKWPTFIAEIVYLGWLIYGLLRFHFKAVK